MSNLTDPFYKEADLFTLSVIYRTAATKRWSIVQVSREQNIAEHMYLVAMTARRFAVVVGASPDLVMECVTWALMHDLPETILGDVPTPTKKIINSNANQSWPDCLFEGAAADLDEVFAGISSAVHGDGKEAAFVRTVVKLADLIEAIRYLQYHGIGGHAKRVQLKLIDRFYWLVDAALLPSALPEYGWQGLRTEYEELITVSEWLTNCGEEKYPI